MVVRITATAAGRVTSVAEGFEKLIAALGPSDAAPAEMSMRAPRTPEEAEAQRRYFSEKLDRLAEAQRLAAAVEPSEPRQFP